MWPLVEVGVLPRLQLWLSKVFAPALVIPPPPTGPPQSDPCSDSESESGCVDDSERERGFSDQFRWTRFALLGADIMVDESGTPWLLEFNHNPALPQLDLSLSAESKPDSGKERVGGAFARHIAAMTCCALPLLLGGEEDQHLETINAAVASTVALAETVDGVAGLWAHVHGPSASARN